MGLLASIGFLAGGFVGFLMRPPAPLIGKLPFEAVITRGANLKGFELALLPLVETSFQYLLTGAVIGIFIGLGLGYSIYPEANEETSDNES